MLLVERGHERGDAFSRSRNNSGIYIALNHLGFLFRPARACAARRTYYAAQGRS
ncbi:hypothetical protein [Streptomyces sp. NPDC056921]|uniref:hypothetical protein n=1 Tax=Streptomyces sp. NPDC056921 TaxID=3345966 RepID=UPI00363E6E2A